MRTSCLEQHKRHAFYLGDHDIDALVLHLRMLCHIIMGLIRSRCPRMGYVAVVGREGAQKRGLAARLHAGHHCTHDLAFVRPLAPRITPVLDTIDKK